MSYSFTESETYTRTHAKKLASKVITDLYQCSVLYGQPSKESIADYEAELIELLAFEYVERYEFGFKKEGKRILSFRYRVGADGGMYGDSDAGALYAKADVSGAAYYNSMSNSQKWHNLTPEKREAFDSTLAFRRTIAALPEDGYGYWQTDHGYVAGGVRVSRETFRPA